MATQPTYTRKKGFFGELKNLGTTAVAGTNKVVINTVDTTVAVTDVAVAIAEGTADAVNIYTNSILEAITSDGVVQAIEAKAEITQLKQAHEIQDEEFESIKASITTRRRRNVRQTT